jgi:hypothetical protein
MKGIQFDNWLFQVKALEISDHNQFYDTVTALAAKLQSSY